MSRMGMDRGEASTDGLAERRRTQSRGEQLAHQKAEFERAFADALRDILNHERRRAA